MRGMERSGAIGRHHPRRLVRAERGAPAAPPLKKINRLHGKSIPSRDGFVAHYERDGAVAMLYVSRAYLGPIARWQLSRMVTGIRRGASNAKGGVAHLKGRGQGGAT